MNIADDGDETLPSSHPSVRLGLLVPVQTRLCDSTLSWSQELGGEREGRQEEEDHGGHDNCRYTLNLLDFGVTDKGT